MKSKLTVGMLLAFSIFWQGCPNSYDRQAYQTLGTTQELVEAALAILKYENDAGNVSQEYYDLLRRDYVLYQEAMNIAIEQASGDTTHWTPEKVLRLSTQLITLIERIEDR